MRELIDLQFWDGTIRSAQYFERARGKILVFPADVPAETNKRPSKKENFFKAPDVKSPRPFGPWRPAGQHQQFPPSVVFFLQAPEFRHRGYQSRCPITCAFRQDGPGGGEGPAVTETRVQGR